jgi:hypothetical protein
VDSMHTIEWSSMAWHRAASMTHGLAEQTEYTPTGSFLRLR